MLARFFSCNYRRRTDPSVGCPHSEQEAFEKCWAHSPLQAAARRITIHQVSLLSRRTPPAHRCPRRRRRQRHRVTGDRYGPME